MQYITNKPLDGARRAFLCIYPHASNADWNVWCDKNLPEGSLDEAALIALAYLCHTCVAKIGSDLADEDLRQICFSAGVFEGIFIERFGDQKKPKQRRLSG